MTAGIVLVLGAILVLDSRTSRVVAAYVVLALYVASASFPAALGAPLTLALFAASFFMKIVVAPIGILSFINRNRSARDLRPALALPLRLLLVIALAVVAQRFGHLSELAAVPAVALAAYIVLCGLAVLIVHRNLIAAIIGLLVLGAGATLAGASLAPALPESIELGAAFDALVATFIGLALVRAFVVHNPLLDVRSLRSLRG